MHEMNGDWYPWGDGINGNTPDKYKQAWIHIHDIFEAEDVTNVKWVWCPNEASTTQTSHPMGDFYPGDAYVDWIALDGYNWAGASSEPWHSFEEIFGTSYGEILAVAPTKPLMIAEYASDERGGDKAQWIRDVKDVVPLKFPKIKALVWFNNDQDGAWWRIDSSPSALQAYQELVADPYFQAVDLE
jgi:beta-mannanase